MIKRIAAAIAQRIRRSSPMEQMLQARAAAVSGMSGAAGVAVNETTAMNFAAVYASVRIIAETKASLPLQVYEMQAGGRKVETKQHPVADLLCCEPNPDQTPMVFGETMQAHLLTWGNCYAEITWSFDAEPIRLTIHHPSKVEPFRGDSGDLLYRVKEGDDSRILDRSQVYHVPGMGGDGILGWSPIRLAAQSIGIGLAQDQFAATYFGNGARPSLVIESPQELGDEVFANLKNEIQTQYSGTNAHKALLLEGGLSAKQMTIPLNEAQFLESRKFQGEEIAARWFRLPPHVAGYLDRATFSNIDAQDRYFERHTMRPWLIRHEQELNRKLFLNSERRTFYAKHNADALLRADIETRYKAYQTALMAGFKTINEVRSLEDLDPVEGGDDIIIAQAIYGQQDPNVPDQVGSVSGRSDPRLGLLLTRTLTGLIHRELTAADRNAGRDDADFRQRVESFYDSHRRTVRERLTGVAENRQIDAIDAELEKHRDDLITAGPKYAREACQTWPDDVDRLVGILTEKAEP